ncbi:hypothetical protein ACMFMG_011674 [Clarireedia jacksonii]
MQFFVPVFALLATSILAIPNTFEARKAEARQLDTRANCNQLRPLCVGGTLFERTNCLCQTQSNSCDLYNCPGDKPNVMVCGQPGEGCVYI